MQRQARPRGPGVGAGRHQRVALARASAQEGIQTFKEDHDPGRYLRRPFPLLRVRAAPVGQDELPHCGQFYHHSQSHERGRLQLYPVEQMKEVLAPVCSTAK
eukprot:5707336-Pleurochrysis_carterae.AAC.2